MKLTTYNAEICRTTGNTKTLQNELIDIMGEEIRLPFGRTQTSETEIRDLTNSNVAIAGLTKLGTQDAKIRVEKFLSALPELLGWLERNGRVYPWRQTTHPWRVYCSEILLQRTRANSVAEVFDDFFETFPDAETMYYASDEKIRTQIESLGFGNQRTRTLREVAELVFIDHDGGVPESEYELRKPWRVGPYSARATLIFAFGDILSLVDSNFARVLERMFGCDLPRQPHKTEIVYQILNGLIPREQGLARAFNLAFLDLGASICSPNSPQCGECPVEQPCAYPDR